MTTPASRGGWRRALVALGTSYRGSQAYLQSALVALLLAPVLPDILIDLTGVEGKATAGVRLGGVALVAAACVAVFAVQNRRHRRDLARIGTLTSNVQPHDTLIIALSLRAGPQYQPRALRTGRLPSILEILVDRITPKTVILLRSPDVPDDAWTQTRDGLTSDGLQTGLLAVPNCEDPVDFVAYVNRALSRGPSGGAVYDLTSVAVDVTGGTKLMSLAMARLAAELDASCVYVTKAFRDADTIEPGTQIPYQFDPRQIVNAGP
ncbi:hypothetical protein Franean1_1373 [Parafrankia sp. EAN1pec]|uniref:hypothetical protein n=1 Tax=Parafrankia sp. (strain EAN1pec) TaxID=298653 RepID=UPI00015D9D6D|nr:hypothetical protein Franean1_1373 [Frankia sp. EAN1pec]